MNVRFRGFKKMFGLEGYPLLKRIIHQGLLMFSGDDAACTSPLLRVGHSVDAANINIKHICDRAVATDYVDHILGNSFHTCHYCDYRNLLSSLHCDNGNRHSLRFTQYISV